MAAGALALLAACTGKPETFHSGPRPILRPTPGPSAAARLLADLGELGRFTWGCSGRHAKLVHFTTDPSSATDEVTVSRHGREGTTRSLAPGKSIEILVTAHGRVMVRLVQETEPRTASVVVYLGFGEGRRCLDYIPPYLNVDSTFAPH